MKKPTIIILIVVATVFSFVAGGATLKIKDVEITVTEGEETVFSKKYEIKFSSALKVLIRYGGSYGRFYKTKYLGNPSACLGELNPDIVADLTEYARGEYREKTDASVKFTDGKFYYFPESDGSFVDEYELLNDAAMRLSKNTVLKVERKTISPEITVETLKRNTVSIAEFSTSFSSSGENRRHNIATAAKKLDNLCVSAGEDLSFNAVVGERTAENGFKEAKIIQDGEFTSGVGGGVCQVSTTLFNCWLKAGLAVKSAAAHSLPVSYVKPSLDAMVSSATDLVLTNDTDYPIYLSAFIKGDSVHFVLYGRPLNCDVKLRSETLKTINGEYETVDEDENCPIDWADGESERILKKAKDGVVSESYRDYYENGVIVKSERLRRNTYKPQKGIKILKK